MTKLLHICFVALQAYPVITNDPSLKEVGGAEVQQCILAKAFAKRGYRVSMICLDYGQPDELFISGIRVIKAHKPHEGIPVLRFIYPRATSIWQAMKMANADIYYQRAAGSQTGLVSFFCRHVGKKMIFATASDTDLMPGKQRIRYKRDKLIYEWGLKNSNLIVTQSITQQELCAKNYNRESVCIRSCYEFSSIIEDDKQIDVLWVATVRSVKRPEFFLELAQKMPELSFKMIGGASNGNNWESYYCQIKELAARIPNLEFVGFVPYGEIDQHFNTSRLFVNTSEYEGFPNTFLQSWIRGIPTVSFFNPEAVIKGRQVSVVVNSIDEMIVKIKELLASSKEYNEIGNICKEYVQQFHSTDKIVDEYTKVFETLIT